MNKYTEWLPADRLYHRDTYLWVKPDNLSGNVVIGMSSPALESLGELAYLTLVQEGENVRRDQSIGTMEAAKMTGEITSPVSGTVVRHNEQVISNPQSVSDDLYGSGWLVEIDSSDIIDDAPQLVDADTLRSLLPEDLLPAN